MISVIVPAYNAAKTIGRCLDALERQTAPRHLYEIIVVDDGSTDSTGHMATRPGVCVIRQTNSGAAATRNAGARQARGEIVVFVDADSVPDARWLECMAAPFADLGIAGASGEKKTRQRNLWARLTQLEYDYKYDLIAAHPTTDFIDSSTAAYRRQVFLTNGGFDTSMMEAEDTELSFRLAEQRLKMVLVREAIVYHTHPESLREYLHRKFRYATWRAVVYARMPHKVRSETRTPQAQKLQVALAMLLVPTALGAWLYAPLTWFAGALVLLFAATTLPFAKWCWSRDRAVAIVAPIVLLLTAYAGCLGGIAGYIRWHTQSSYSKV